MKKHLLSLLFLSPSLLFSQTIIQSDNFDSYTSGNPVAAKTKLDFGKLGLEPLEKSKTLWLVVHTLQV